MGKTVFVTGLAGYLGECLGRELDRGDFCDRFYGIDVKAPLSKYDRGEFRRLDVTGKSAAAWIREIRPDVLIHMAFVVTPVHDENLMHRVNVSGTRNVMEAALAAGVKQIMVTSSGTAYGAFADNPVPLSETDPIRRHPDFPYARDKAEVEAYLSDFQAKHPEISLCWVRPSVIYGPSVNNYISALFTLPVALAPVGSAPPFQFVHEDDVVSAMLFLLEKEAAGPYNLAPPDFMTVSEVNALTKRPALPMTDAMLKAAFALSWKFSLPILKAPPSFVDYVRYPWAVDPKKLMDLGFSFRYSTRETMEIMLRSKGVLR